MDDRVDILLATWQGRAWLDEQVASLLAQTHPGCRILAGDDGSTDGTAERLDALAAEHPGRIRRVPGGGGLGAAGNFSRLLAASDAPYAMFCDQDDVWDADKVAVTLAEMRRLEAAHGDATPILVHTDLAVVDGDLRPVSPSLWRFQRLCPRRGARFHRALVQNAVTGCTAMLNRALVRVATPVPREAVMHDWWAGLVAAGLGVVGWIPRATVRYRQHGRNSLGARAWGPAWIVRRARAFFAPDGLRASIARSQVQARALRDRIGAALDPRRRAALEAYCGLEGRGFLGRRVAVVRHRLLLVGVVRNLGWMLRL